MPRGKRYYPRKRTPPQPQHVPEPVPTWRDLLPGWRDAFWYIAKTVGMAAAAHFAGLLVQDLALSWREGQELLKEISDRQPLVGPFEVIDSDSIPDIEGYSWSDNIIDDELPDRAPYPRRWWWNPDGYD